MAIHFQQVTIVGVGLIGGSVGMVLKRARLAESVVGIDSRADELKTAMALGAIDRYALDPGESVAQAELVVLATPIETYARQLTNWGERLQDGTIVSDVGSVKGPLVLQAEQLLPARVRFVGAHPIAGREKTGVAAGSADLFRGARCILTPTERTDPSALRVIEGLWQEAGAIVSCLDPFLHDRVLGAVSHLPHAVAFVLMNTLTSLCDRSGAEPDLFPYAGGGLRDTTRIAASSPELWRDIFLWNRNNVLEMIDVYEQQLRQLKRLIEAGDSSAIQEELERAKRAREQCEAPMGFPGMAAQPTVD